MKKTWGILSLMAVFLLLAIGCSEDVSNSEPVAITFESVVQIGGTSGFADSTELKFTFSADPATLTADDITVTGATKGGLSGTGTTRMLAISDITVADGETVTVAIVDPSGFSLSGSPKTVVVYKAPVPVAFESVVQTGGSSGIADTTALTLAFSVDPATLTGDDITVTGATKGALSGTGTIRTLAIAGITVPNGGTVSVAIANPNGYVMSGSSRTAVVYRDTRIPVTFQSVVQIGGTSASVSSTGLRLTFSANPTTLSADDITITGATKGVLSGSGTTRTLTISDITAVNGATVSVAITNLSGYAISGSPQTAVVYRPPHIGMPYQGGIIAYIYQSGDPGYVSGQLHGLVASTADLSDGIKWRNESNTIVGATGTALGTGQANTIAIVNNQGAGSYAAQLCNDYVNTDAGTGVYSDWYLPSKDEMEKFYLNRISIGGFVTGAHGSTYWTSTEDDIYGNNCPYAWFQYFSLHRQYSDYKYKLKRVRAVRYF